MIGRSTYNLSYDAENHLTGVSGAVSATFVYDGDGNRVKGTVGGSTTAYIGSHFEFISSTSTMKKYYYEGGTRVAMRTNTYNPKYLLGDHLGSTAIIANYDGAFYGEKRYMPWGEERWASGTIPTTYLYTGQREEEGLGLYFYNARWYDPYLNRFIQPDTIIPDPSNPLDWDRFAYSRNNPLNYLDPTGNEPCLPKFCGYTHDTDGNKPTSEWLQEALKTEALDISEKYRELAKEGTTIYWGGLSTSDKVILEAGGWEEGSFNDHMTDQTSPADLWHDPLLYLEVITVGGGLLRAGIRMPGSIVPPVPQVFHHGGESWHLGLETKDHMNIIHVGNHPEYGIHIAFGAVKPYMAYLHIYLTNTFPFFRTWRPK